MTIVRGAAALSAMAIAGLSLLAPGAGCDECDLGSRCLEKEGLLVEDEIYPVCGAEPTHDGDRYSWATDAGTCSCTLESGTVAGYNWRDCELDGTNVAGEGGSTVDPPGGCGQYAGCDACTNADCAYCAPTGECQDYGSGQTCAEPTIDLPSDCGG